MLSAAVVSARSRSGPPALTVPLRSGGAGSVLDRQGLAGEGRFVDHRRLVQQRAVNRQHLAALHHQTVAGPHLLDRQILETIGRLAMRRARAAGQQGRELTVGAALGELLQHVAAGEHQRDHHAGQGLAQRQRTGHGQAGDDVHARLTLPQLAADLEQQERQCRYDAGGPDHHGERRPPREPDTTAPEQGQGGPRPWLCRAA